MRACIQRVSQAQVVVDGEITGQIEVGLLVLLGVAEADTEVELKWLADKIAYLRIFPDAAGKMNLSLVDVGGSMLVVSQFTLYGDCRKGRRPSFVDAAQPEKAEQMYNQFVSYVSGQGVSGQRVSGQGVSGQGVAERGRAGGDGTAGLGIPVATGRFRADMQVSLTNDGPVTLWIDTANK